MDLSPGRFDQLVNLIYDTLDDKSAWRRVLESLNEALGTRAVHMLAFDATHGTLSFSDGANMAPQIDIEYIRTYQYIDPRVNQMRAQPGDTWMHCHEHFDEEFVANDPFYQEFLLPNGARYLSACKLVEDSTATIMLACLRRPADGPLPPEAIAFLDGLRPHMARACRIGLANFVYSTQALVGHALVNKLRQPVLLLTTQGEVVQVNQAASALLRETSLVAVENGRLVLPQPHLDAFLDQCVQLEEQIRFSTDPATLAEGYRSLHIAASAGAGTADTMYGFFSMLVPEQVMGSFGVRPLVMLFLYHPRSAQEIDSSLLQAAFGLSQAECRIATLLADGMQLKNIAETLGVQYDTVRKQLLSIYQKTSTNRQPELVRLLLHLPAAAVQRAVAADPVALPLDA